MNKFVEEKAAEVKSQNPSTEKIDLTLTYLASEKVLAKDWLTPEEDQAWKDL